ncbi:IS701 family transposase [Clostridium tarantellae]|uniref:IS701 family transposase n=1 Tax=Clostridium tarantellae TaxID=39493 RepID=A0A6I1MNX7_9CLOT|nr:IS701 family transposase [Clostridium tarantellae]MPQ45206.1 IS701 family transposase [Clostridium tarantellae]
MFQELIIPDNLSLDKFLRELNFDLYLTKPQLKHLQSIINAMMATGFNGKMSQVAETDSTKHRTSVSRFMSSSSWDESLLQRSLRDFVLDIIWKKSNETQKPIYFIIDDTISKKTKPSSKAINPIEKCAFAYSHLENKQVFGHQIIVSLLSCDNLKLPYSIDLYDKNTMSKIELSQNLIKSLPKPIKKGVVLCDSWYSSKAIFKSSKDNKYNYIGAIKTNRVIFPHNHERLGIKVYSFAKSLDINSFDLVTVNKNEYYIYKYTGDLTDMKNVSIVLSYPKESFHDNKCLRAFISLDTSLSAIDILIQYSERWDIEPFFKSCKANLGLNGYQVRVEKAITRYLLLMILNYTYCSLNSNGLNHFNTGFKVIRNNLKKAKITSIYNAAQNGVPLEKIFEQLKVA